MRWSAAPALGLDLAEELGKLAPFGMGNPGVRLLVPSARVRDVRTMGEGDRHARFSLHSGAHRALGVAFGRSSLGVGDDDPVDAAVRLEVNHWNGSVEPRVVLRELYPRELPGGGAARVEAQAMSGGALRGASWRATSPSARWLRRRLESSRPRRTPPAAPTAPAAVVCELPPAARVSSPWSPTPAHCAPLCRSRGVALAGYAELERAPELPRAASPTWSSSTRRPSPIWRSAASRRAGEEVASCTACWGEAEWRFALPGPRASSSPARPALVADVQGPARRAARRRRRGACWRRCAARGRSRAAPRRPRAASACSPSSASCRAPRRRRRHGRGRILRGDRIWSARPRSAHTRARYEEGQRYLEGRKQP